MYIEGHLFFNFACILNINLIVAYISSFSVLLPFIILLANYKAFWRYNHWLSLFIINNFISEAVTGTLAVYKIYNMLALDLFSIVEAFFIILLYYKSYKSKALKKFILWLLPFYITGQILIYLNFDRNSQFNGYTYAFHSALILIPIILYFWEKVNLLEDVYITKNPMFWVSAGFLPFYSVSILHYSLINYLFYHYTHLLGVLGLIHSIMLIIMDILLSKGLWLIPEE